MTKFAKTKSRVGFEKNAFSGMYSITAPHSLEDGTHEVERNLKLIAHHNAQSLLRPEMYPSEDDFEEVEKYKSGHYYCLAPASVWETKRSEEHTSELQSR